MNREISAATPIEVSDAPPNALPSMVEFEDALALCFESGKRLAVADDCRVALEEPSLLATSCRNHAIDDAVRKVTLFAFVLSAVVLVLVAVGAVPKPLLFIIAMWISVAAVARHAARRRRLELGEALIALDRGKLFFRPWGHELRALTLDGAMVVTEAALDGEAMAWVVLRYPSGAAVRLARAEHRDVDRVLTVIRRHRVPVLAGHHTDD